MYAKRRWFTLIFIFLSLFVHAIVMSPLAYASAPIANETLLFGPTTFRAQPNPQNQIANFTTATAGSATLLIVNGTGLDLSLEKCSGSLFKRLVCELENIIKGVTALLTCAQNVQMELNGQTVLTGSEVNLKVFNYKRVIPVGSGTNTFKVKVKGLPTASITIKIIGGSGTPPTNQPPVANFSSQVDSQNPLLVHFNGSSSSDPDGSISLYIWSFGDGQSGQGVSISHLYSMAGTYSITLAVTDNQGASASNSQSITLENPNLAPTISLTTTALSGTAPHLVVFDATGSFDPEQDALTYLWNFGDGITTTGAYVSHQYMTPNNYVTQLRVRDARGGESVTNITIAALAPVSPIDPALIAPPLPIQQGSTPAGPGLQFLYTGANPVQTGVAPGIIDTKRAGSIRGRVLDRAGAGIAGVEVSVLKHPEYGKTLTRPDGFYDLVVNGGSLVTLNFKRSGYFTVQRQLKLDWQLMAAIDDVLMIGLDPKVTSLQLNSPNAQVAQGSVVNDSDGARQAILLIPSQTSATLKLPGGGTQSVNKLSLRATEYTVGASGPQAMPGPLPPQSAYTYAVEFSADEAIAAGALEIEFNKPVPVYVDNFINMPVGFNVPVGYYDRQDGHWVATEDGLVMKLLAIDQGKAVLDLEGNNTPAGLSILTANGINDEELAQIATLYSPGKTFWRAPTTHLTPFDHNFFFEPPPDAATPPTQEKPPKKSKEKPPGGEKNICNSILEVDRGTAGEEIDIAGTGMQLAYRSDRVIGNGDRIDIDLSASLVGKTAPSRILLYIWIAGRQFTQVFLNPGSHLKTTFIWDGLDVYGRQVQGASYARIGISYEHQAVYVGTARFSSGGSASPRRSFGSLPSGVTSTTNPTRQTIKFDREYFVAIHHLDYRFQKMGGWSLSAHHYYDPISQVLHLGDGRVQHRTGVVDTVAGNGAPGVAIDGQLGTQTSMASPQGLAVLPDGSLLIASASQLRVRVLRPSGILDTFAGGANTIAENVPATQSRVTPVDVAVMPTGEVLIAEANRVRKVDLNGIIRTVAGTGVAGFSGDGGPAISAQFNTIAGIEAGADGSYYVLDQNNNRIRRVLPDGLIYTAVGTGVAGNGGDGGLATQAQIRFPNGLGVGSDGTLYIADTVNNRVRRVLPSGLIETIAIGSPLDPPTARLNQPRDVVVGPDGAIYVVNSSGNTSPNTVVRMTPDGRLNPVVGLATGGFNGDGHDPKQTQLNNPMAMEIGPDQSIYIAELTGHRIRRVTTGFPRFTGTSARVADENGSRYYLFSAEGLHLETRDTLTNALIHKFNYQGGLLSSIEDAFGNQVSILRDSNGQAQEIISPYGQHSFLNINSSGYLTSVRNQLNEEYALTYHPDTGLLASFQTPRGHTTSFQYNSSGELVREDTPNLGFINFLRQDLASPRQGRQVLISTAEGRQSSMSVESSINGNVSVTHVSEDGTTRTVNGRDGYDTYQNEDGSSIITQRQAHSLFGGQSYFTNLEQMTMRPGLTRIIQRSQSAVATPQGSGFNITSFSETLSLNNKTFTSTYDGINKAFTDLSPEGRQSLRQLDSFGRLASEQIGNLAPTSFIYEPRGRLSEIHQGPRITKINYDAAGFVDSIENPLHQTTSFDYDAVGRVLVQTLPDLRQIQFTYDSNGNLSSITPPSRPAHGFLYSTVDLISSYLPPSLGGPAANTVYSYNKDKQLTRIARPDGKNVDFVYASGKRQLASIQAPSGAYSYSYSPTSGLLTSINAPDGVIMSYAYDGSLPRLFTWSGAINGSVAFGYNNDFQVSAVSVNGSGVSYSYDNDGLLKSAGALSITRDTNGLITSTQLGSIGDNYFYNSFGEVTLYTATGYSVSYIRDDLGRIVQKTEDVIGLISVYDYIYDNAGRLDQVRKNNTLISDYNYDGNSNRVAHNATVGTYDNQDRLLTYGQNSYTYTNNGELLSKTDLQTNQTTSYIYDEFGNLQQVTLPNGDVIEYIIDGQNRRVGKKVNGTLAQGFLYQDQLEPIAELDGSGNVIARFIYASKSNVPDFMFKNGNTYRIISDHLGSPRLIINIATNQVVQQIDYDDFGNTLSDSFPGFQPFGFAGAIFDNSTKLNRFGQRDYDSEIGRWLSKDPILFAGGDTNLYGYTFNDPINFVDPSGTFGFAGAGIGYISGFVGGYAATGSFSAALIGGLAGAATGFILPSASTATGIFFSNIASNLAGQLLANAVDPRPGFRVDPVSPVLSGIGGAIGGGIGSAISSSARTGAVAEGLGSGLCERGGSSLFGNQPIDISPLFTPIRR